METSGGELAGQNFADQEQEKELFSCIFCTNNAPYKTIKRVRNFSGKVTLFCHALNLPLETFETGIKYAPLCNGCLEIILSIASIQKTMEELGLKLVLLKKTLAKLLKLQHKVSQQEVGAKACKKFSPAKFRERIQEQLGVINSSEGCQEVGKTDSVPSVYNTENSLESTSEANRQQDDHLESVTKSIKVLDSSMFKRKIRKKKSLSKVSKLKQENCDESTEPVNAAEKNNGKTSEPQEDSTLLKQKERLRRQDENNSKLVKCTFIDPSNGQCRYRFINEEKMDIHLKRYHLNLPKNQMYQCTHCPRTTSCESKLELHMKLHTGKTELPCDVCQTSFRTEYLLTKHKVKVHGVAYPFICEQCNEGFINKADLNYHSYSHSGNWPYPCDECSAGFPSKARLARHKQYNHNDQKELNFACKVCKKNFHSAGVLSRHEKSHEAERPFKCNICSWSFKFNSLLKTHMISVHSDDRPFLCQECGAAFKLNKQLLVHLRGHDVRKRPFLTRNRRHKPPSLPPTSSSGKLLVDEKSMDEEIPENKISSISNCEQSSYTSSYCLNWSEYF